MNEVSRRYWRLVLWMFVGFTGMPAGLWIALAASSAWSVVGACVMGLSGGVASAQLLLVSREAREHNQRILSARPTPPHA